MHRWVARGSRHRLAKASPKKHAARIINADRSLPSDSDFRFAIQNAFCYVDRTQYIKPLLESEKRVLFLRPRRFGKSFWLSTLESFFSGDVELFKGLAVSNTMIQRSGFTWSPSEPDTHNFPACPVIRFDFSQLVTRKTIFATYPSVDCEFALRRMVEAAGHQHQVKTAGEDSAAMLASLIIQLAQRNSNRWKKVVVLIDEHDTLWASSFRSRNMETERPEINQLVVTFYTTLKSLAEHIEFTFVTGVAPVLLAGVRGGANDLRDCSLDPIFSNLMGFTQAEVKHLIQARNMTIKMQDVEKKYNGYCWDKQDLANTSYNPFLIREICATEGMPSFGTGFGHQSAVQLLHGPRPELKLPAMISEAELLHASQDFAENSIVTKECVLSLLFRTGYATIKRVQTVPDNDPKLELDYPSEEVRSIVLKDVFSFYGLEMEMPRLAAQSEQMANCFNGGPAIDRFFQIFNDVLASRIAQWPSDTSTQQPKPTGMFATVLLMTLCLSSKLEVQPEANNLHGYNGGAISIRTDSDVVHIFDFKTIAGGQSDNAFGEHMQSTGQQNVRETRNTTALMKNSRHPNSSVIHHAVVCSAATGQVISVERVEA